MECVYLDILGLFILSEYEMLCFCYDRLIYEVDRVCSIVKLDCIFNC